MFDFFNFFSFGKEVLTGFVFHRLYFLRCIGTYSSTPCVSRSRWLKNTNRTPRVAHPAALRLTTKNPVEELCSDVHNVTCQPDVPRNERLLCFLASWSDYLVLEMRYLMSTLRLTPQQRSLCTWWKAGTTVLQRADKWLSRGCI